MRWEKLGQIYCPHPTEQYQYAMFPVADIRDENSGLVRIYYTQRDSENYGFPTYMEGILCEDTFTITYNHRGSILDRNALGTFDDSGVNITCLLKDDTRRLFYYLAWNLGVTVPFRNAVGVAKEEAGSNNLQRVFPGPILDRTKEFPYLATTPYVIKDNGLYKMWFACGEPWIGKSDGTLEVACHIEYAESKDGYDWRREGIVSVGHLSGDHITTTPFVIKENDIYKMWYSYRGEKYRIGYAESFDGKTFIRKDAEVGITVSESGWDSEMICYPNVFDLQGARYLLYSGNAYGKDGIGLAKLIEE